MNNKRLLDFFGYLSFLIYFIIVFIKTGMIGGGLLGLTLLLYYVIYIVFIDGVGNTMARMVAVRIKMPSIMAARPSKMTKNEMNVSGEMSRNKPKADVINTRKSLFLSIDL